MFYTGLASGFCGVQKHCVFQCFSMIWHSWDLQKWRPQAPQIKMVKMVQKAFWPFWYEMVKMVKMTILTILIILYKNGKNAFWSIFQKHFISKWYHFFTLRKTILTPSWGETEMLQIHIAFGVEIPMPNEYDLMDFQETCEI